MLDIKYIREHAEEVKKNCENRGIKVDVDRLLELDEKRRAKISEVEQLRSARNQGSKGKPSDEEITKMREVGDDITRLEKELETIEADYLKSLKAVPNLTHPDAPIGGEADYKVLETVGKVPEFKFKPKDHEELMLALDVIDFERGTKTSGAKFYFTKNDLVLLNHALIQYGVDVLRKHDFVIMETPDLVKNEILSGVGFAPRGPESNTYATEEGDLSLIATAEITLGGYHAREVLDLSKGPLKYAGISHCFRKEAGTYGKASKGLYRVHQFTKLEMFVYCKPEESEALHQELLKIEKEIVDGLELSYQVIDTASRDLGAPAYRKFDIEAWMVMNNGYGEITSTSNCTDYQARRLNIRYRSENGETSFVHTLNGTAVVNSRFPIAIFENFQQKDGSIKIPKVLQKYMGGIKEIKLKK
ncbi:MAG: serine--tRNA ligase [Candidatus Taylorbacteria bacterium RIFCSPHIGHO2_01_FULL_46_22b]|uniref:Serine--tRNA ligase n=1 Tax=Candidatus Taylorbacteria bacterium RIFCSPHIGHO2_01_FULL_46_22b TaxID=1802301 RepID=A0A1G2M2Q8_9BACT|nr:MAG: serine--tRNA ligase [Candidatus Taylorbacteria bacterium RIFCSPHIGHO2_01_FULL_46_22b]